MKNHDFLRSNKRIILIGIITLIFCSSNNLFAQNWTKQDLKNSWGDVTGYAYYQAIISAVAHGNKDVTVNVTFCYSTNLMKDGFAIFSKTLGDFEIHPASGFLNESITLSLRSNGVTSTYQGFTVAQQSNYNTVAIFVQDIELINKLRTSGQWDVLIEGRNWYIRTTIRGNLP